MVPHLAPAERDRLLAPVLAQRDRAFATPSAPRAPAPVRYVAPPEPSARCIARRVKARREASVNLQRYVGATIATADRMTDDAAAAAYLQRAANRLNRQLYCPEGAWALCDALEIANGRDRLEQEALRRGGQP